MFTNRFICLLIASLCIGFFSPGTAVAKPYKGAEIYSAESAKYGRYVMRMRMAKGSGLLSTFFTYKNGSEISGALWEEIDIEVLGKNDAYQMQSNIIVGSPRQTTEALHTASHSLADNYHTYTLEWTPDYVAWFIDGQQVRKINGGNFVSSLVNPQTMRFNIWASTSEPWVGAFNSSILPVYQFINYMEYHAYNTNTKSFTLSWRDDFNSFDTNRWGKADWTFDGNYVDFDPANVVVKNGTLILALTTENAKGFSGSVPVDGNTSSATSSSSIKSSSSSSSNTSSKSSTSSITSSTSAGGLSCTAKVVNNWGSGYQLEVVIHNGGTVTMNGWNLTLTFSENPQRTGGWNAIIAGSGNLVTASNLNWNGTIAPNQSVSFGLQGNHDGSFVTPGCKVN